MKNFNYNGLTGKIITKDNEEYYKSTLSWNRAINKLPLVIVYCYKEVDVINSIKWAIKNSLEFRVRSGCHSYEGFSTDNDVLVIDISNLKYIEINEDEQYVKLGAGIINEEAYESLGKIGYAFPGGGCPTVGVSGLILGGGWGYSSRYLGLACDNLIEAEIINYKGEKLILNNKKNEDLFWAIQGSGGSSFGVITSVTLRLKEKVNNGTLIYINYPNLSKEKIVEIISELQKLYKNLDIRMNLKTSIYNSTLSGRGVKIIGLFYGNSNEAKLILKDLLNITESIEIKFEDKSIFECNKWIQDSHPEFEKYKSTGRFVYKDYNEDEILKFVNIIDSKNNGCTYTAITFYGLGGIISDIEKEDTAFYYRNAKFILGFQAVWEEDIYEKENKLWFLENFSIIKSMTVGSFVNFPLKELENYEKEYYGENIYKLRKIKSKYDPNNIFKHPQSIKLMLKEQFME